MAEIVVNPYGEDDPEDSMGTCRTYRMDFEKKRIVGMADGLDAAGQSIVKALQTRRFAHRIYDDQYGNDMFNKIGNSDLTDDFFDTDIPEMIRDCLSVNDMVDEVEDITFEKVGPDAVKIDLFVKTIFGVVDLQEVIDNG